MGIPLSEEIGALNLERLQWIGRRYYTVECNWKVFIDNYLDGGYHVPHVHRALDSLLDYGNYTIENGERHCLQSSPLSAESGDARTAAVRRGARAFYYWTYPNFMINVYEGAVDTNLVLPRGVSQTEVIFDFYAEEDSSEDHKRHLEIIAVAEGIQAEDAAICRSVQRGLASRSYTAGRLSVRREAGEHLFHRLLHADLSRALM
jgi:choline monooxygenase